MNVPDLHERAVDAFGSRVQRVKAGMWHDATPHPDWDVRTLVNHLVGENLWTPPLLAGSRIEALGDRFDGDLLGGDPKGAWAESSTKAIRAVHEDGAMDRTVHLSFGDVPGEE